MELIVRKNGVEERVVVERHGDERAVVCVGDRRYEVDWRLGRDGLSLELAGRSVEVGVNERSRGPGSALYWVSRRGRIAEVEVLEPLAYLAREANRKRGKGGVLRVEAMMPGRVVTVLVEAGETVEAGQGVVVLEAMKMENEIVAEEAGVIGEIHVQAGQAVEGGDSLFELTLAD